MHKSLELELNAACVIDPGLADIIALVGIPDPRNRAPGFATIAEIINAQQLSTRAASAIWGRIVSECGGTVTPRRIVNRDISVLKKCGLSERKISYIQGLAQSIVTGEMELASVVNLPDETLIVELTKIKGMGRWSAEIYAMFALARKDIFPAGDLALRIAVQRYMKLRERPNEQFVREVAQKWSPHQSAVAVLMWKFYGAMTLN